MSPLSNCTFLTLQKTLEHAFSERNCSFLNALNKIPDFDFGSAFQFFYFEEEKKTSSPLDTGGKLIPIKKNSWPHNHWK